MTYPYRNRDIGNSCREVLSSGDVEHFKNLYDDIFVNYDSYYKDSFSNMPQYIGENFPKSILTLVLYFNCRDINVYKYILSKNYMDNNICEKLKGIKI